MLIFAYEFQALTFVTQKNPVAAAALNSFFWGTGYSYADIKSPFGLPWLIWPIVFVLWYIILFAINYVSLTNLLLSTYGLGYAGSTNPFSLYQVVCTYADPSTGICISEDTVYNAGALGAILAVQVLLGSPLAYDAYKRTGGLGGGERAQSAGVQVPARICPQCSAALDGMAEFCPQCGHNVENVAVSGTEFPGVGSQKRCDNCGTYNPGQYSFCKRCGQKLS